MSDCWIITYTGVKFDLLDPQPEQVRLADIAVALSRLARFTGHTAGDHPYSVAQHCLEGLPHAGSHHAFEWLLHDAHEAYTNDINGPLKAFCPEYSRIQERIDIAVRMRFQLPLKPSPQVKSVDKRMLATERRDVMPQAKEEWPSLANTKPFPGDPIKPRPERSVRSEFLRVVRSWIPSHVPTHVFGPDLLEPIKGQ